MTSADPEPVEACETPIWDALATQKRVIDELRAALAEPTRITVADFEAAAEALHDNWRHCSGCFSCEHEQPWATTDEYEREFARALLAVVLPAAGIEVDRG